MPTEGVAIVPVGLTGTGLVPADVISVEPSGIPVGETYDALPSGEVAPMVGVGTTIPLTCARATLAVSSAGRAAAIGKNLIRSLRCIPNKPRPGFFGPFTPGICTNIRFATETPAVHCQKESGRLTTMGVDVLRTTTQRNDSTSDGLISMCGRKAGT
jgi:hypothetical protein